ncbi:Bet5-like protein [Giardia muris]|uniref:Trafficking protein particle complex subunit n=1 Tax=Giardia muris TaxID=5742 RepID=A0A4Z1T9J4_GIAMU|nr:Bet5-like protein [Giardia muris]|eukprot:TNJ29199.1 Bet5-like protein [Giardia muris]
MPVLQFYAFRRGGEVLQFTPLDPPGVGPSEMLPNLIFMLRVVGGTIVPEEKPRLEYFDTEGYRCHLYETATGYWFVFLTTRGVRYLGPELAAVYRDLFVKRVVENPDWEPGTSFDDNVAFRKGIIFLASTIDE